LTSACKVSLGVCVPPQPSSIPHRANERVPRVNKEVIGFAIVVISFRG
jgi:hypothetical protein